MIWLIVFGKAIGSKTCTVFGFTSLPLTPGYRFVTKKGRWKNSGFGTLFLYFTLKPTSCSKALNCNDIFHKIIICNLFLKWSFLCHIHRVIRHYCFTLGTRAIFCFVLLNSSRRIFIKPCAPFLFLLSWVF